MFLPVDFYVGSCLILPSLTEINNSIWTNLGYFPFLTKLSKNSENCFLLWELTRSEIYPGLTEIPIQTKNFENIKFFIWLGKFHEQVWRFQPTFYSEGKISLTFNQNIFTSKLFLFHLNDFTDATIQQCAIHQVSIITLLNFIHFFRYTLKVIILFGTTFTVAMRW